MSQLRRIEDLRGPPTVGVMYDVPWLGSFPIIPLIHTDEGLARSHVHIDMRFVTDVAKEQLGGCLPHEISYRVGGRWRGIVLCCPSGTSFGRLPARCLRERKWPAGLAISGATNYATKPVYKNGRFYCPHRGADVTGMPMSREGFIRCPLHGQLIDMRAGLEER
jgi:hypothetical protein